MSSAQLFTSDDRGVRNAGSCGFCVRIIRSHSESQPSLYNDESERSLHNDVPTEHLLHQWRGVRKNCSLYDSDQLDAQVVLELRPAKVVDHGFGRAIGPVSQGRHRWRRQSPFPGCRSPRGDFQTAAFLYLGRNRA